MTFPPLRTSAARLPLLWLSLVFLAGILAASLVSLSVGGWGFLLLFCLVLLIALHRVALPPALAWLVHGGKIAPLPVLMLLAALCGGALRYQLSQAIVDQSTVAFYNDSGEVVRLTGWVTEPPDERDTFTLLRVRITGMDGAPKVHGDVQVSAAAGLDVRYGDSVRLVGELLNPPEDEDFSYRAYLARQGVYSVMYRAGVQVVQRGGGNPLLRALYRFREQALARLLTIFPMPEAGFLAGVLLGYRHAMPATLEEAFRITGTAHIVAISGFNMAIVAGLFAAGFRRIWGAGKGFLAAAVGVMLYTLLVGANPAVVRAALMSLLALSAGQLGRRAAGLNVLGFTAAMMAFIDPNLPWDVGFQLSVAATAGLVLYAAPFQQAFEQMAAKVLPAGMVRKISAPVAEYILFTLAAQLTTLPVILYHFHRLSLISVLINPLVLPAQPAVMILGGVAVLAGLLLQPLGKMIGWLAYVPAAYTLRLIDRAARLPHAEIAGVPFPLWAVIVFYAVLLFLTLRAQWLARVRLTLRPAIGLAALGLAGLFIWRAVPAQADSYLHLYQPSTTERALLLRAPGGAALLFDGGSSSTALRAFLGAHLPPMQRTLDALVICSAEQDDIGALPGLLEVYTPALVWSVPPEGSSRSLQQVESALLEKGITLQRVERGAALTLGRGITLQAERIRAEGASFTLTYAGFSATLSCLPGEPTLRLPVALPDDPGWMELLTDGSRLWLKGGI